ncbi:MAG: hypothetical protein EOP34_03240 [Rickettsiales bacterium]|nr:MAG: hypothetical protein EOP34_03240 [Rickettsiales bacterium]
MKKANQKKYNLNIENTMNLIKYKSKHFIEAKRYTIRALIFLYVIFLPFVPLKNATAANPFTASKIKDLDSLTLEVKNQVQGNGVNIVANFIGIITLIMGAGTMNLRLLSFAVGALVFINTFFPFVNHSLGQ